MFFFYFQNEQKGTPTWEFSDLIDHPVTFTQICPQLPLYTKRAKIDHVPETITL